MLLFIFAFLQFLIFDSVISIESQNECNTKINILTDISATLSKEHFKIQQQFIASSIISNITNLNNFQYSIYASTDSSITVPWNSNISEQNFKNTVFQTEQLHEASSLLRAIQQLSLAVFTDHKLQFSAIVLVTDTSLNETDMTKSVEIYKKYLKNNIFLTFIAVGGKSDIQMLENFEVQIFDWRNLNKNAPNLWDLNEAIGCSPMRSSSTIPPTTLEPYIPCSGYITILSDTSDVLSPENFGKQQNFIISFLKEITHFERIRYGSYSAASGSIDFGFHQNNTQIQLQKAISETKQTDSGVRLLMAMQTLLQNAVEVEERAICFLTDTSSLFDIQKAYNLYNLTLKNSTNITLILLGEKANAADLIDFEGVNIFEWKNMTLEEPIEWNISKAFGCL